MNNKSSFDVDLYNLLKKSSSDNNNCKNWNIWRKKNPKATIRLIEANFEGLNLSGANLSSKNYNINSDVMLCGSNFKFTNLELVNLDQASLIHTVFDNANLSGASLKKADLQGASAVHSKFTGTCLVEAYITSAKFKHCCFYNANMTNSLLSCSEFVSVSFCGATLYNAYLDDVRLKNTDITNSIFDGANINGAWILGAFGKIKSAKRLKYDFLNLSSNSEQEVMRPFNKEKITRLFEQGCLNQLTMV